MLEIARLIENDHVELPPDVARRFRLHDRFLVWVEGDTIHLRRMRTSPLTVVAEAPDDQPMSLEEINEIVHEVRRTKVADA